MGGVHATIVAVGEQQALHIRVSATLLIQQSMRMRHIILSSVASGSTFFNIIT